MPELPEIVTGQAIFSMARRGKFLIILADTK